jgi:hypothetical protein
VIRPPTPRGRLHDEEGAIAVLVALSLTVLIGAAALAIDLGSGFATKRDLVTDLDAAALAGARTLADGLRENPKSCTSAPTGPLRKAVEDSVAAMLAANGGVTDGEKPTIDCARRTVRVEGSQQARTTFAPLMGVEEIRPSGYAVAKAVDSGGGPILPLTICKDSSAIAPFFGEPTPVGLTVTIPHQSTVDDLCGGSQPNFGFWGESGASELKSWMETSPPDSVDVRLSPLRCTAPKASPEPGWCNGETGKKVSVMQSLKARASSSGCNLHSPAANCEVLTILLHDQFTCAGNCANDAIFKPYGFLDVLVRDVDPDEHITVELVGLRLGEDATSDPMTSSALCSADGAPSGDPGCD